MADGEDRSPEDEFQELMRQLFGGQPGALDPDQLARLSGMGIDPAMMATVMQNLRGMFAQAPADGIPWDMAKRQALHIANQGGLGISNTERADLGEAFTLATLWLSEATTISELSAPARTLTRGGWVEATLPVWQELAEPVALSIADALTDALDEQVPEEMRAVVQGAGKLMRTVGGSLFAAQLGAVVGRLSTEVVSGGDVGLPVMPAGEAAILPQNFADFGRDLGIADDQLALYLATRELAHARLFRHAKWLRLHVITQVTEFARGIRVDTSALEDLAARFDPSQPEELRQALESGALLPQRTEAQTAALGRLETLLALIEGWVDVVTDDATARLPEAYRIAEVVRRRRAVGGPAEQALGSLVGLEVRPRRLREAAAMWRSVTDAVGIAGRDSLWDYPDLMPGAADIDDPAALVARMQAHARGDEPERDAMDEALEALLNDAQADAAGGGAGAPADGGTEDGAGDTDGAAEDDPDGDAAGPRPV
ncbi:zinc-dependent metalloprotease [Microbacterium sp. zg.Y1090]|uniref:zinc-dependent metalloprotease n=1 Tax=Microbacterium TaxID=33882 RepID=UPI00214CE26C|nr:MULTISPECIES: zinc-dependent metalloprotease [unclassified Microbacterium]MCR2812054.1 zinc-dependent metalloprotease [Microbacterium sp. zg.Y1084]MCR2818507.1 zinc-dependent metalloprotease [Microbacterium sp. zg.Y1090]MDL5486320.1 zinc-dependent metalloprotease [Microbacterium sp. zg-Y1211]WIM29515.1 zinc-dependent metalloprotease [Microbacterium sp. zg-Y1090]